MTYDPNLNDADRVEEVYEDEGAGVERREAVVHDVGREREVTVFRINQIILIIAGIIEGLLGIRFLLKLMAANPGNPFANFINNVTAPLVAPFASLVANPDLGGVVFELTTLVAMIVYALVFWVITRLILVVFTPNRSKTVSTYRRDTNR